MRLLSVLIRRRLRGKNLPCCRYRHCHWRGANFINPIDVNNVFWNNASQPKNDSRVGWVIAYADTSHGSNEFGVCTQSDRKWSVERQDGEHESSSADVVIFVTKKLERNWHFWFLFELIFGSVEIFLFIRLLKNGKEIFVVVVVFDKCQSHLDLWHINNSFVIYWGGFLSIERYLARFNRNEMILS